MLKEFDQDTIAAISTPPGEGGIGIIRISGPQAIEVADGIFQSSRKKKVRDQPSFSAQHGFILDLEVSKKDQKVDEVLLLLMRAPKSYTCENVVEIHAHGGSAVLKKILDLAIRRGARLASKGEFTKRAFLNGRMDLLQAEAVMDLVKAKTELGRKWATAQLEGALSQKIKSIKNELLQILTQLEAAVDFPDDGLDTNSSKDTQERLRELENEITRLLSRSDLGFIAKNGLKIVIAGRPNVGKSSLMNRLSGMDRVIVTPYAGTTRDTVEEETQIHGFPVRLVDTAGIQETDNPIERAGIERSKSAVGEAALVLYVMNGSESWDQEDSELIGGLDQKNTILVINKADLPQKISLSDIQRTCHDITYVFTSCVSANGIESLEKEILRFITHGESHLSDEVVINSVRQKDLLEKTLGSLRDAENACSEKLSPEFIAVDVRLGLDYLGMLAGEVVTDDILELLFSQFCIGK